MLTDCAPVGISREYVSIKAPKIPVLPPTRMLETNDKPKLGELIFSGIRVGISVFSAVGYAHFSSVIISPESAAARPGSIPPPTML